MEIIVYCFRGVGYLPAFSAFFNGMGVVKYILHKNRDFGKDNILKTQGRNVETSYETYY